MRIFCSICKDIFIPYAEIFVTNCGHLYHGSCILTWTQENQTCPQCRSGLTEPFRVYLDVDKDSEKDSSVLEHELEKVSDKLREAEQRNRELTTQNKDFEVVVNSMRDCAATLSQKNSSLKTSVKALKQKVTQMTVLVAESVTLKSEINEWKTKVAALQRVDDMMKSSAVDVNSMLQATPVTPLSVKQLCTYVGVLKTQLENLQTKNLMLSKENNEMRKKISEEKLKESLNSEETVKNLRKSNSALENELCNLKILIRQYRKKLEEKKKDTSTSSSNVTHGKNSNKRLSFSVDLSDDEAENKANGSEVQSHLKSPAEEKRILNWEDLISSGNQSLGMKGLLMRRPPCRPLKSHPSASNMEMSSTRFDETYAFDGLGGRKKVKLGGPTPTEEFKQIKKKKQPTLKKQTIKF